MDKIVRKFHSFDEADNADYEYYRALFGNERLQILLELIMPENPDAIVGAWALAFHGRPRYTGDIDIFVARDEENAAKVMELIEAFGFGQSGIKRGDFIQADHVIQLGRAPNRIDILTGISGVLFDEAWKSREQGIISDVAVFVISRDLLIEEFQASVWLTAEALRTRSKSNEIIIVNKPSANSVLLSKNNDQHVCHKVQSSCG